MVWNHRPTVEEIVWDFYAILHQKRGDSFLTWVRGKVSKVTPTIISNITGASCVRDLVYPWPIDHLPTRADMVECFIEGRLHQMETEGEGNFQLSDLNNDIQCIYHILTSQVHLVLSRTMITIKEAYCLYTLLIETLINFGSLVTTTMVFV